MCIYKVLCILWICITWYKNFDDAYTYRTRKIKECDACNVLDKLIYCNFYDDI